MRRYETVFIMDPDTPEAERATALGRISDLIAQDGGYLSQVEEWGIKKLAYEIKRKNRGYYIRLDFCGMGKTVEEMERFFKIDDRFIKFMTIQTEEQTDIERVKAEVAGKLSPQKAEEATGSGEEKASEEGAATEEAEEEEK